MAGLITTVQDLVDEVRSMLDEDNRISVKDDEDILPAINRAQNYASNILARHYESPMLTNTTQAMTSGQREYYIPEGAFEQRIEKVEVSVNGLYYPMQRINYRDISLYETQGSTDIPYYYCVVGDRYRVLPTGNGAYSLRVWYLEDPAPLVLPQGRITSVNSGGNYVLVDSVGSDLTTEVDNLNSYVNLVDGQTGKRKGSLQVKTISGNKITFKSTPLRTTVLGTTVGDSISGFTDEQGNSLTVEPDDYICVIKGNCVPFFRKPFSNFIIQYAIAEIRRKLGGPADIELRVLEDLEAQVERSWVGREQYLRVSKKNDKWSMPVRRVYGQRN